MSKLFDDFKETVKEWTSVAVEKAEEVGKIAVAKTEELTKVSKIKIEEHQFQRELSKLYEDMGRMVTKYAKDENMVNFSGNQEFFQIIENIEKIQLKIDKKIAEIKKIKEEYNITDVEVDNVIDKTNLDSQIEVEDVPAEINSDENQNSKKD